MLENDLNFVEIVMEDSMEMVFVIDKELMVVTINNKKKEQLLFIEFRQRSYTNYPR